MKRFAIGLFLFVGISTAFLSQDKDIPPIAPDVAILRVSPAARVEVRMSNSSTASIRLFEDWNSWGAMNWRVLRIRNGKTDTFYQSPYQGFTRNFPASFELRPGDHHNATLDINGGYWCGLGRCSFDEKNSLGGQKITFEKGDQIIVIYDVAPSEESQKFHVFSGVVAASTIVQ